MPKCPKCPKCYKKHKGLSGRSIAVTTWITLRKPFGSITTQVSIDNSGFCKECLQKLKQHLDEWWKGKV